MKKWIVISLFFCSFKGESQFIHLLAGTGTAGYNGDAGLAEYAQLNEPLGVATDDSGNVYIADFNNSRVRKINHITGVISTIAGGGWGIDGSPAATASVYHPSDIAIDTANNIYISESGHNKIRKITASTGLISTIATIYYPQGIALDDSANVYVAETSLQRIIKISVATGAHTTIAGNGISGYNGDSIPATSAQLASPFGVAVDVSGNVYIGDVFNHRVRKVTKSTGLISTIAGSGFAGFNGDGVAVNSSLQLPQSVDLDAFGNLYVADEGNSRIRKINSLSGIMTTIAGTFIPGYNGDEIIATTAWLYMPYGVSVDSNGNIYIGDTGTNLVREITNSTLGASEIANPQSSGTLFPNPATNQLTIESEEPIKEINILNLLGELVISIPRWEAREGHVNIQQLPSGIYFVHVITEKGIINKKLIKE